jgi:hypothetical protein
MNRRRALLLVACCMLVVVPVVAAGTPLPDNTTETTSVPEPDPALVEPDEDDRRLGRDLRDLAEAWASGGGEFGYPFWEKAGQRWRTGQVTTTMYREYVTGYRDQLRVGCELVDSIDVDTPESDDVKSLVLDSCGRRVEALRAQQQWLDDLAARDAGRITSEDDIAELDERIAERETSYREALQESFRDARLALDQSQAALESAGLERLPEDAFI